MLAILLVLGFLGSFVGKTSEAVLGAVHAESLAMSDGSQGRWEHDWDGFCLLVGSNPTSRV